jgi:WD40 repeat protein
LSAIFISHSSADNAVAAEIKAWLEEQGHRSVFLDFDPEVGIPAGRSWEQELYRQLRACRAVIFICSASSTASRWCFAEITHARSLGKPIFPLKVDGCTVDPVLTDRQIIDMTADRELALGRLDRGLTLAGLDASHPFDWDGSRPPYPGLLCFEEKDAAVFFGRDEQVGRTLDLLTQMRRYGGTGLLLLLGGSGSGKSSLMRAGVVPRLRRDDDHWLVVDPFRPGEDPAGRLAEALSDALGRFGQMHTPTEVRRELDGDGAEADPGASLVKLVRELQRAAGRREASVLLFLDQFEELLGHPSDHPAGRFLAMLRGALEAPGTPVFVVGTLRSDFLATFQKNAGLRGLPFRQLALGPITVEGLTDVIVKPAALAGLDMEPGLVQALLHDAQDDDALPLLAFTLRELYELVRADASSLRVSDYQKRLGGLKGSIARAAEGVLAANPPTREEEDELRGAFLGMVRVDEDGHYARRTMGWSALSERAHEWLERFVRARLLVARGDREQGTVEVAHEALFRAWEKLAAWLQENREVLLLRHELVQAVKVWERGGRSEEDLWRGGRLQRALEIRDQAFERRRNPRPGATGSRLPVAPEELDFLASAELAERRARRRRQRRRVAILGASLLATAAMSVLFVLARQARFRANTKAAAVQARVHQRDRLDLALLLGLEVGNRGDLLESRRVLWEALESSERPQLQILLHGHRDDVRAVAWSPDGRLLASAGGADPTVLLWDVAAERPTGRPLPGASAGAWALDWSPNGRTLAAAGEDGSVVLWDAYEPPADPRRLVDSAGPARRPDSARLDSVRFSPDGRWLAAARSDGAVRLWDVAGGGSEGPLLEGSEQRLWSLAWSPDGKVIAAAGRDKLIRLWDAATGEPVGRPLRGHLEAVLGLAWNGNGTRFASASRDRSVALWDGSPGPPLRYARRIYPLIDDLAGVVFSPTADRLALASLDGRIAVWDVEPDRPLGPPAYAQRAALSSIVFSPDGERLASGNGRAVAIWRARSAPRMARLDQLDASVQHVSTAPGGATLALVVQQANSDELALWLWDRGTGERLDEIDGLGRRAPTVGWSADGRFVLTVDRDRNVQRREVSTGRLLDEWRLPVDAEVDRRSARLPRRAWSADATKLVGARPDGTLELWDVVARKPLATMPAGTDSSPVTIISWRSDGGAVAIGSQDGTVRLIDGATGETLAERTAAHGNAVRSLSWSSEAGTLASGGEDRLARIWGPDLVPIGDPLSGHARSVNRLAFSPDGKTLVSAAEDQEILLWDVESQEAFAGPFSAHEQPIATVAFDADGKGFSSVGRDGRILQWDLDPASLRERACRIANRNLTAEEWERHLPDSRPADTCPAAPSAGGRRTSP